MLIKHMYIATTEVLLLLTYLKEENDQFLYDAEPIPFRHLHYLPGSFQPEDIFDSDMLDSSFFESYR